MTFDEIINGLKENEPLLVKSVKKITGSKAKIGVLIGVEWSIYGNFEGAYVRFIGKKEPVWFRAIPKMQWKLGDALYVDDLKIYKE